MMNETDVLRGPVSAAGVSQAAVADSARPVALWLLICCAAIYAMVVLGGVTRLTGSGLSIVEWEPVVGVIPPLSEQAWEAEFAKYRESPEYRKVNPNMTLAGFQSIYWLEYAHRLVGRSIGLLFLAPFLYFAFRRRIDRPLARALFGIFLLGGLQGVLGWYMVQSGLVHDPHVSPYRLAAHLGLAFLIYAALFRTALDLLLPRPQRHVAALRPLRRRTALVTGLAFVTVLAGAFVAGLKAGFSYNTFPLMDGRWIPQGLFTLEPAWRNVFENVIAVQFNHRLLAISLLLAIAGLWLSARRYALPARTRLAFHAVFGLALLQVTLGIATLLLRVPIPLASAHQAGALALFTALLFAAHELRGTAHNRKQA